MEKNDGPNPIELRSMLEDIINDYETAGCDGCGTVSLSVINRARKLLGYELLEDAEN